MEAFNPYTEAAYNRRFNRLAWALGAILLTYALCSCARHPQQNAKPSAYGAIDRTSANPVTTR